ncbi:hypothetical protein LI177_05220 [bacterium 210820-DFI.6.37]|nr:hypothetical protein [bacterium 210820-DFI.6.37]
MAAKNAILKAMIEGVVTDIMVKTNAENVTVTDGATEKTLAEKLAEIATSAASGITAAEADSKISAAISGLIDGAPATYDTLKEIADYISTHEEVVAALNSAIGNKVDKESGKGLSANDFTNAYKAALDSYATKVANWDSAYNHSQAAHAPAGAQANKIETVKVNGTALTPDSSKAVDVPVPVIYAQTSTPANLKAGDLFLQITE